MAFILFLVGLFMGWHPLLLLLFLFAAVCSLADY